MNLCKHLLASVIFAVNISYAQTPTIANLKLDNKQSILNNKAYFLFPEKAINSSRQTDIMAADPNINRETRIMMDIDKMRLVFFARELFVSSDDNLLSAVSKGNGHDFKSKVLSRSDSLLSVLTTPVTFDTTKNAILINSLMVKTQDNSVFQINAYINTEAFKYWQDYQILSEKVFSTLSKGTRRLDYKARTETFPIFGTNKSFRIQLPDGFIVTKDQKYDFEVLHFQKIKNIADTNWVNMTMYMGHHPSYFYGEYDLDPGKADKVSSRFLNNDIDWMFFKNPGKQFYLKEQKIPADNISKDLIIHIAMMANQQSTIADLTRLVEGIKLSEK